jgi:hypothetical protein
MSLGSLHAASGCGHALRGTIVPKQKHRETSRNASMQNLQQHLLPELMQCLDSCHPLHTTPIRHQQLQ